MNGRSGEGGGDGGDGGGGLTPVGVQRQDGIQDTLQSIAHTVGQMQETMMTMIRKMERTDEAVRGVERRLTEQGEIVQMIGNRMNVLDTSLQSRDPASETEPRCSKSTPTADADSAAGHTNPAHSQAAIRSDRPSSPTSSPPRHVPAYPPPPATAPLPPPAAVPARKTSSLPPAVFPARPRQPSSPSSRQTKPHSPSRPRQTSPKCSVSLPPVSLSRHSSSPHFPAPYSPPRSGHHRTPQRSPRSQRSTHISRNSSAPRSHHSARQAHSISSAGSMFNSRATSTCLPSPYDVHVSSSNTSTSSSYSSGSSFTSDDVRHAKLLQSESSDEFSLRAPRILSPKTNMSMFGASAASSSRHPRPPTPVSVPHVPEPTIPKAKPVMRSASTSPSPPSIVAGSASSSSSSSLNRCSTKAFYSSRPDADEEPVVHACFVATPKRSVSFTRASYYSIQFPAPTQVRNPSKTGLAGVGRAGSGANPCGRRARCRSPGRGRGTGAARSPRVQSQSPSRGRNAPAGSCSNPSFAEQSTPSSPGRPVAPPGTPPSFGCQEEYASRCAQLARFLLAASHEGKAEKVVSLLDSGADVNCTNSLKWTPLHKAAAKAHAEVVAILLQRGADVHAATSYGFTALHMAAYNDRSGNCMSHLLQAGSDFNCGNRCGRTALHAAVECGNVAAMLALLAAGADKSLKDEEGRTPFDMAKTLCVKRLLRVCGRGRRACSRSRHPKDGVNALVAAAAAGNPALRCLPCERPSTASKLRRFWRCWRRSKKANGTSETKEARATPCESPTLMPSAWPHRAPLTRHTASRPAGRKSPVLKWSI